MRSVVFGTLVTFKEDHVVVAGERILAVVSEHEETRIGGYILWGLRFCLIYLLS